MKTAQVIFTVMMALWMSVSHSVPISADRDKLIKELKTKILQIAARPQGGAACSAPAGEQYDNKIRATLDPLVNQLVSLANERTPKEKLSDVVGAWHMIWSDGPSHMRGTWPYTGQTYQVIFPNGYFWTVSKLEDAERIVTGFLRGQYELEPDGLKIEFTKAVVQDGWPSIGTDVNILAMRAEVGAFDASPREFDGQGPLGTKATRIMDVYVDDNLRISRGGGVDFPDTYLYILERQNLL